MNTSIKFLAACALLALPSVASGQSADVKYCMALGDKYNDFVGHDDLARGTTPTPAYISVAIEKCTSGGAATSIPVLEQALKNAKLTLPPRP